MEESQKATYLEINHLAALKMDLKMMSPENILNLTLISLPLKIVLKGHSYYIFLQYLQMFHNSWNKQHPFPVAPHRYVAALSQPGGRDDFGGPEFVVQ